MTTVMIDPAEMERVAGTVRAIATELESIASGLYSVCACEVPPSIGATIDADMAAARLTVSDASGGYNLAAQDLLARSAMLVGDQSMATAFDTAYGAPTQPTPGGSVVSAVGLTDDWLSAMDDGTVEPATSTLTGDWLAGMDSAVAEPATAGMTSDWLAGMDTYASQPAPTGTTGDWLSGMDSAGDQSTSAGATSGWMSGMDTSAGGTAEFGLGGDWVSSMAAANVGTPAGWSSLSASDIQAQWDANHLLYPNLTGGVSASDISNVMIGLGNHLEGTYSAPAGVYGTDFGGVLTDGAGHFGQLADTYRLAGDWNYRIYP